jgi:plasmid maintenance system antidote protein VapI
MAVARQPMAGHPGKFIRDVLIPEYGLNVAAAARLMDINRKGFINALDGQVSVTRELAYRLGALMGDEVADLLIQWQLKHDLETEEEKRAGYRQTIKRMEPLRQPA